MSEERVTLDQIVTSGEVALGRGEIISSEAMNAEPGDYPVYSSSARGTGEFGRYGKFMFDEELITWSVDGGGRPFYRPKHRFSVTNVCGYLQLRDKSKWDYRYLHAAMVLQHQGISFDYQMKAHPSVIKKLYSFSRCSLPIQQRIAEILSTVDEAIEQTEALIAKTQQIKAGLMHDLFTRGVTPDGQLRPPRDEAPHLYQESPLGWIPKAWSFSSLESLSVLMTNGFVGTATPFYSGSNDSVTYLYGNNIRPNKIEYSGSLRVSRQFHESQRKSQLRPGDMLTVQSGHIGTSALVPQGVDLTNCHALIITRFKEGAIVPEYASHYLNSAIGMARMSTVFVGSTILHINTSDLKRFVIPHPTSWDEQVAITGQLLDSQAVIDAERAFLAKLTQKKQGLMHDLLTGHVRVPVSAERTKAGR